MRTIRERSSTVELLVGIVLAEAGVALVGCGEWDLLKMGRPLLFYAVGFLLLVVGMFLIWKEPLSAVLVEDEAMPISATGKCKMLGWIDLNGIYCEAYEEETGHGGKRFRLQSFPPMGPEREAALSGTSFMKASSRKGGPASASGSRRKRVGHSSSKLSSP